MTTTLRPPSDPPPTDPPPGASPARRRGRSVRSAWLVGGSILTVAILLLAGVQIVSRLAHQVTTIHRTFATSELDGVRILEVRNRMGSTAIVGTSGESIDLTARVSRGLLPTQHEQRIVGDRLVLTADCPIALNDFCQVDYDIEVPEGIEVVVRGERGRTTVTDVEGPVDIDSKHAAVTLTRVGDPLQIDLEHGSLRAAQLTSETAAVRSQHGSIALEFAAAPSG
ncbi:MAG: hypothetical protein JJE52_02015 [Acidimicrobiia bacterium]|nr:hypothetical protein [Acidimicrobiia bacterium]